MSPQPRIGDVIAGHRIIRLIGEGGMGAVYLAEHEVLERQTALKILPDDLASDESFRQRFLRESRLAAQLAKHPNILPVYDANIWHAGQPDEVLYIAMYYVEGTDLGSLIDSDGPFSLTRTLHILEQVASALDAAHARGLVHRDVKPTNILIERDGVSRTKDRCYLADFGVVKEVESRAALTRTGSFIGTADYAAPEQLDPKILEGEGPIDGRADVYSLGCVLYQCLTKHSPYEDKATIRDLVFAHLLQPPPSLSKYRGDLPAGLDDVIAKAMAKKRDDRYSTCGELVSAAARSLREPVAPPTLAGGGARVPMPGANENRESIPAKSPSRRRLPVAKIVVAMVLIAALIVGVLVLFGRDKGGGDATITPTFGPTSATREIAFESSRGGNLDIYVMNIDGSDLRQLTNSPGEDQNPAWSADGARIAFTSNRFGQADIFVMNADGQGIARLTTDPSTDAAPTWSPDGTKIAFESDRDGNRDIWVMDANGGNAKNLTADLADDLLPAWSPDGTKIAFQTNRDGNYQVYVMAPDGSDPVTLTKSLSSDGGPAWSPDGALIAFTRRTGGNLDVYVMNSDGSDLKRLTFVGKSDRAPAWSPDGLQIAFESDRDGNKELYVVDVAGSSVVRLTNDPADDANVSFRPTPAKETP